MKFVTQISTKSKVTSLSDFAKAMQTKTAMQTNGTVTKTASAVASPKVANIGNFGDKKAKPFGKEDEEIEVEVEGDDSEVKEAKEAAAKTKSTKKKASSESEEGESSGQPEAEAKLVNKPKAPEGSKAKASGGSSESDEAESSGQLDVEPLHQEGESTGKKKSDKSAANNYQWIKVANLTSEQKTIVRKELEKFWPKKFVDALLLDR